MGWSNDGGPGASRALPREEGPSGGVAAVGLVLEGEDSEVAQGLWLGRCMNTDLSWLHGPAAVDQSLASV